MSNKTNGPISQFLITLSLALAATASMGQSDQRGFDFSRSPDAIGADCDTVLEVARGRLNELSAADGTATFDNVMRPFDLMLVDLFDEFFIDYLMTNVHPDEAVRTAAAGCFQKLYAFYNGLSLNRPLYNRVSAVHICELPVDDAYMVDYWLAEFQSAGVDKDEATRKKAQALNDEIVAIGEEFDTNIREAVDRITVSATRLAGLPQDFIDAHPVDDEGNISISTSYADVQPVLKYAVDDELRRELYRVYSDRAYPENDAVLKRLLQKRYELATLLGRKNYAELAMIGTMMGSPDRAKEFLGTLNDAIKPSVAKEKSQLLARLRKIDPEAKRVERWQTSYLSNLLRQEEYALDAKEVREYFHYDRVRDGIMGLTSDLFDIEIEPWKTDSWHADAKAYNVLDDGQLIGRFFLDMHPRDGKYTHAAQLGLQFGVKGKQIPIAALVANFPKGAMEHDQVETFLHEFGHLLHFMFAGQDDIGFRRLMSEDDFGEAPSRMLEEWVWDYETLATFAKNDADERIPRELVKKMNRVRYFGQGVGTASQISYATFSLSVYDRDPANIDIAKLAAEIERRTHPFGHLEGVHSYANFGHLNWYSSNYYTYQWSNAIAEDLLSRFREEGLRNTKTAAEYRKVVLGATGTKSANGLVADFLGREFTIDAYVGLLSRATGN